MPARRRFIFVVLSLTIAAAALAARSVTALGTRALLDWDETYYASTTATASNGLGLYPYVLGYPQIPNMGGVGYVVYFYVGAYKSLGPNLVALRAVSLLASLAAVAGVWVLTRRVHGPPAALAAVALLPSLLIFQLSNSIRLDTFIIAHVAWVLVLYVHAAGRRSTGLHALVGAAFALGLEIHLHTAAAAFAVGCAYLARAIGVLGRDEPREGRAVKPLAAFVGGYAAGALLFLALNVLPNAHAYFRTAALARLSAVESGKTLNLTATMDSGRLAQTFFSPALILNKEIERYTTMATDMRWWEALLWLVAIPVYLSVRRGDRRYPGRLLLPAAVLGGGIVFNSSSPLYASTLLPFFVPALATLVTDGFATRDEVGRSSVSLASVALLAVLAVAILPTALSRTAGGIARLRSDTARGELPIVGVVHAAASPECILAGPTDLYAAHFMRYPRFVGTRQVEVLIGSTYYDLQNNLVEYWRQKRPDLVFGPAGSGLDAYLVEANYSSIADGVWRKPGALSDGCAIVR